MVPLAAVGVRPAGNRSVKLTLVASAPPLLVTSIWNVTISPSSGVALPESNVFTVTRSAATTIAVGSSGSPSLLASLFVASVGSSESSTTVVPPGESPPATAWFTSAPLTKAVVSAFGSTSMVTLTSNDSPLAITPVPSSRLSVGPPA